MLVGGIFGPKKSGKTTLARALAEGYWLSEDRASLVNDPNSSGWPKCCWQPPASFNGRTLSPDNREALFWDNVWKTQHKLIICDDAGKSINRNADLNDIFTRINHNGHKLLIIGHNGSNLLPIQREQMDDVYLFRSTLDACKWWYDVFGDDKIFSAATLNRYEFLRCRFYEPTEKHILQL